MGVIEGGLGDVDRTSPHKAAIDTIHAEHRQECDGRNKRKRELEFLEKGGNPLDYELGNAASVSVQSTSFVDQQPYNFVDSEAKCNFPNTASPYGDSLESSGRPGEPPREPNTGDNILLFDAEPILSEGDQSSLQPSRSETVPPERSVQIAGNRSSRENGDSAAVGLPGKAYKRRNRYRQNRDSGRPTSNDPNPTHDNNGSSVPAQLSSRDVKGLLTDGEHQNVSLDSNLQPTDPVDNTPREALLTEGVQHESEVESLRSAEPIKDMIADASTDTALDAYVPKNHTDKFKQGSPSAIEAPSQMGSDGTDVKQAAEELVSAAVECRPCETAVDVDNQPSYSQMNGKKEDVTTIDCHHACTSIVKGSDLESSSSQTNTNDFGNNDGHICTGVKSADSNGEIKNQNIDSKELLVLETDRLVNKEKHYDGVDTSTFVKKELDYNCQISPEKGSASGPGEKLKLSFSALENRAVDDVIIKGPQARVSTGSVSERKSMDPLCDDPDLESQAVPPIGQKDVKDPSIPDLVKAGPSNGVSPVLVDLQSCSASELKVTNKIDEDSILKEAQIIQAKRKRIAELSVPSRPTEILQRAHWDYVLEEIAWLANDFSQERIWKMAASAQISYRAACACCLKKQEFNSSMELKKVAHKLARAVMEFWLSVDLKYKETEEELEMQRKKNGALSVRAYAVRFVKHNKANILENHVEVPLTPDRISDYENFDMSGDTDFAEEKLFYMVSPGVMQAYRKSIESHVGHAEKIGYIAPEEMETSACDTATAFESEGTVYDDDEGETSTYNISEAFECSKSARFAQLKQKHTAHAYGARSYDIGPNLSPMLSAENKFMSQQSASVFKRPGSNLNVSIPTKRVRTASRRVVSPFNAVGSGSIQVPIKADASSGDTNSYQDDQSTLRAGLLLPNSLEVESTGDFEKQLPLDSAEVSTKSKKRKKPKHLNADYEEHWQVDSTFHNDQFERDHLKKRSDSHHLEFNGNNGLSGQSMMKKPKIVRQLHDSSFDNMPPAGSLPSPAASQMTNMSIPNKFIKILSGRDRMRKDKTLKSSHGQLGSGSPWSLFEDQALVVLVHDLGPNWELVSDALNSVLHFKCIFRKAKECKARHSALMDRSSGEGGDSAEDSGSSQAYPATLPGIPKGTARQLFQRLQGPIEEDTLKSYFEKIIMIMQKQHGRKAQDHNQIPPHNSHAIALSQVFPNNLNGGPVLTPLDLCDANPSGPEILSLGHQGPNPSGLAIASQGNGNPVLPPGSNPARQGSPNAMIGNNFSASPGRPNSSVSRDIRYPAPSPRSASLSLEEQQRLQMYGQMISDRNMLSPSVSSPRAQPGTDRGVRIHPGGNGVGMVSGVNRSLPIARPGLQGMSSPSMVNSGNSMSSAAGMHSSLGPTGHGSSVLRPREPLHMMRPGLGPEQQRQIMMSEHHVPGIGQGVSHFGGLGTPFANQASSPVSSYAISLPISPQQPHHPHVKGPQNPGSSAQQQAYAIRLAKERLLQQRFRQQQQQQYAGSNSSPNAQPQPQQPISSPMHNSSQVQPQTSSSMSPSPLAAAGPVNSIPQPSQKQIAPNQVVIRENAPAGQGGKQRQRQQQLLSQANRLHPQPRAQLQNQQQGKAAAKAGGRGNMMHQNISTLNGVSTNSGTGKGEPVTAVSPVQPPRPSVTVSPTSNQSMPQQKPYPGPGSSLPKNLKITSQSNNVGQAHIQPVLSSAHQSVPTLAMSGSSNQLTPSNQRSMNKNQAALQRVAKPNNLVNSAPPTSQSRDPNANQHSTRTSSAVDPVTPLPQPSNSSADVAQVASPASAHQWHAPEQLMESNNNANNLSSLVSTPSNLGQQGHSQKPTLGPTIPSKPAQVPQPHSPVYQSPQQHKQPLLPTNSQKQTQLLQSGSGDLYGSLDPLE